MDETTKARREQATPGATLWRHVEVSHVRRGLQFLIKSVPRSWSGCCAATLDALCVGVGVTLGFAGVVVRVGPTPLIGRMLALSRHGAMPFTVASDGSTGCESTEGSIARGAFGH